MNLDRYTQELETLLRSRAVADWALWTGRGDGAVAPEASERWGDLLRPEALAELRGAQGGTNAVANGKWILAAAENEALRQATLEVRTQCRSRMAGALVRLGGDHLPYLMSEPILAQQATPAALGRDDGFEAAGSVYQLCLDELSAATDSARDALGLAAGMNSWSRPRPHRAARICRQAAQLLRLTESPFHDAMTAVGESLGGEGSWISLPGFLAGADWQPDLPRADGALAVHVLEGLGLRDVTSGRLALDLATAQAMRPGARAFVIGAGQQVRGCWRSMGPLRDYRGVVRVLGMCLPSALMEDRSGFVEARGMDPAIAAAFGALLEGLVRHSRWIEQMLNRPPPRGLARLWRLHLWLRLRQLADVVVGVGVARDEPEIAASGTDPARATGFEHPDWPVPWSESWGGAADELSGWLAAAVISDYLATRFGVAWWRSARAGKLLRDLWAAGPFSTLEVMCTELSGQSPQVEALLEAWLPLRGPQG